MLLYQVSSSVDLLDDQQLCCEPTVNWASGSLLTYLSVQPLTGSPVTAQYKYCSMCW